MQDGGEVELRGDALAANTEDRRQGNIFRDGSSVEWMTIAQLRINQVRTAPEDVETPGKMV